MSVLFLDKSVLRRERMMEERMFGDAPGRRDLETVLDLYAEANDPRYAQNSQAYRDHSRRLAAKRRQYPSS